MTAAYHLTEDPTHWIMAVFIVCVAALALFALWWDYKMSQRKRQEAEDAVMAGWFAQSHVTVVEAPKDWDEEGWA